MAFVFEDDEKQAAASTAGGGGGRYVFEDDEPAGPVIRQGKDPSLIDRVFDLFENPDKERAKAVQALVDAEVFNIRPSDAMRYRAAIDEGVKLNKNAIAASRRTGVMDRIGQSWDIGVKQVQIGLYGSDVVMNNNAESFKTMQEIQSTMPGEDEIFIPESKLEYAFRSAAKMSPMMFQVMKESVKVGLPAAMGVGGAVALLGQAGPQALLPEEVVTVPVGAAIGFKAGATGAAFTEALKLESGLAFSEFLMLKDDQGNQIDPNIARAAAFGVGAVNAGLEVAQVKMLLKTIPGSEKILKNAIMEAVASKVLKDRLASVATMYAGTVAKETAQELAQESTNIVMEHVAANVNNALKGTDIKASDMAAVLDRLFETGKESAAAFSIMALPGSLARALPTGKRESTPDAAGSPSLTGQDTIKAVASPADKTSQGPFILGVNEDAAGEVKSFTMADPKTGETFEVPALKAEDKDTVRYVPDMSALDTQADIDTQIDRIIEGQEDIDQISAKIFQDDIDDAKIEGLIASQMYRAAAWHGSPHTFDKFSTEKIGTGEGAQAYGYGLYFAGKKEVADYYKKTLAKKTIDGLPLDEFLDTRPKLSTIYDALRMLKERNPNATIEDANKFYADQKPYRDTMSAIDALYTYETVENAKRMRPDIAYRIDELLEEGRLKVEKGHLYEVELAPEEDEYLLWDKPLSEQSEKVKAALEEIGQGRKYNLGLSDDLTDAYNGSILNGETLYRYMANQYGDKAASEYLHSLGIRGIKYLDATSRGKGEGAYNYVVFSDDDVEIKERYKLLSGQKSTPITRETVESVFPGQKVEQDGDTFTVSLKNGLEVKIDVVPEIVPNQRDYEKGYGQPRLQEGEYISGVYIRRQGDSKTGQIKVVTRAGRVDLHHESIHFLDDFGILTRREKRLIDRAARRRYAGHGMSQDERIAEWLAHEIPEANTFIGRAWQKVRDFIDRLVNAFGVETAHGVVRNIRSGEIFGREPGSSVNMDGSQYRLVKAINDSIGEKGSIDLEPLVNLGRSIMAEGHQTLEAFTARAKELLSDVWEKVKYHIQAAWSILNNERGSVNIGDVTKDKGTASDIPAKRNPAAASGEPDFQTGVPVTFDYIHNTEKAPNMGSRFGQDKEPAGTYIRTKPITFTPQKNIETGRVTFNNPLVVDFGGGYEEATNWKNVLSERYNGKTGKALSAALAKDGYDGIVTISKYGSSEIVILPTAKQIKVLPNPSRPPEVGGQSTLYSGVDPTQIIPVLKSLTNNIQEAWPHLEALGLKAYESGKSTYSAWSAEMKSYLGDLWESFKGIMATLWESVKTLWESVKAFNESLGERGSVSWKKKPTTEEINMMLSAAARQDQATGGNLAPESYLDLQAQAAQEAFAVIEKKMTRTQKREAAMLARQGEADARLMPVYSAMSHIVNAGGMSLKSLQADYDGNTIRELMNKRPGLVSKKGTMGPDVFADQHGFESGDDMINAILDWRGLKAEGKAQAEEFFKYYEKVIATDDMAAMREEFEAAERKAMDRLTKKYKPRAAKGLKTFIRQKTGQERPKDRLVTEYDALAEAFRKEARTAREAFRAGKKGEVEKSKEKMRWLMRRRESLKNVRDYFGLTDAELMSATKRRNVGLMDDAEFKQFLRNVELKAVELAETRQEKMALLKLIEEKRLKKVDNYRRALELPTFNDMTAQQLRDFAKLLEPFQDDDIFLTQRELETVDRTDLKGIKTWREARERLAKEAGVPVEELNKVHVEALDSFRWDTALRERDAFFGILVEQMTQSYVGAQLRAHEIENRTYELARKSEKSRDRGIIDRLIPQDDLIMAYLEAPMDQKAAIVEQMTPEQIDFANYMQQYFAGALEYLMATKSLERGRENYFVHIRKTFLENLKDGGLKKAVSEIFKTYQQDQMVFNILDDDTGKILPLEKFFQFSLQRTDTMDPTRNVTKAFLTYVNTFEKKKMFDAIIPKLDIYAQALTPTRYTPRGLEIDRSLKTFVNKWINNKKGRRISFDSTLRQGGPLDVGIRALRAFTTILDLGLSPIVQIAAFIGEQVTNAAMLGNKAMAIGTARMRTAQGKAILKKYESWVGRSLWEEFTVPGKEITERLSHALFAGFHLSSVSANKQFLLASLTEQEWATGEISTERLAEMRLDMGRFRVVPGTGSLVGSTSVGDAVMQYKKWAAPFARTLAMDAQKFLGDLKSKPIGEALTSREARELYRLAYLSMAVFVVGAMAGADDDDKSVMGKAKARMYREAMTLMQGVDPTLWLASPRLLTWLYQTASALKSVALMETYKSGDKEGELKGPDKLKRQFVPGVVRSVTRKDEPKR